MRRRVMVAKERAVIDYEGASGLTNQAQRRVEDGAGRAQARNVTASECSLQRLVRPMWEERLHSDADNAETQMEISS